MQDAQADLLQRVKRLTETLSRETNRRAGAEEQAAEMGQRRGKLEAELGQLQHQLEQVQKQHHSCGKICSRRSSS